jgi:hypothetical protein
MKVLLEKYYSLIPVLLLCVFCTYRAIYFPIHDFSNYYFGGYFVVENHFTPNLYFPYYFNKEIVALGHQPLFAGFAPNSPFLALLFCPFTLLPLATAKLVFNCISVVLFICSLSRLISYYKINPIYVLLVPIVFLVPIKNNLLFGQVYFLLFFLLSESWLSYEKKQFKKTGIFLSLAILLKVFPLLLVLLFLFKKQFKPFIYTLIFCSILVFITTLFCGFDVWFFYAQNVLVKASNGGIASAYVVNYQSVFMFLKKLLVFDETQNPDAFFNQPQLFSALLMAFKIGLIAIGFYISKKITDSLFVFSYWILAMIMISPYGSTYTFILLLFPYFAFTKTEISNLKKGTLLVLLFLTDNLLLRFFTDNPFPFSYLRLFVLTLFFILFVSIVYKTINWKMVSMVSIIPMFLLFLSNKNELQSSSYFFKKSSPLLIHDYKVNNNQLTYFYWNENGENAKSIPVESQNSRLLELKENQVFYNQKQLTFDKSNKLKPILINAQTILYLSDYDRGIGFYTLRKLDLNIKKNQNAVK